MTEQDDVHVELYISSDDDEEDAFVDALEDLPTSDDKRIISETTLVKDNDDTTRLQPILLSPYDNRYIAQVVYEQVDDREWKMHFIVGKHLNGLLEYIKTSLPHNVDRDVHLNFSFQDSDGYIELVIDGEQRYPFNGWSIIPHLAPLRISKRDVDMFAAQSPPSFCSILITISVEPGPNTVTTLNYSISFKGIKPENMKIPIIQSISNIDDNTDINKLRHVIRNVLVKHYTSLHEISRSCLLSLAAQMYAADLISSAVHQSPSFDSIIDEYKAGLSFMSTLPEIVHYCVKFLSILTKIGGPCARASQVIRELWIKDCKAECGVELQLDLNGPDKEKLKSTLMKKKDMT